MCACLRMLSRLPFNNMVVTLCVSGCSCNYPCGTQQVLFGPFL